MYESPITIIETQIRTEIESKIDKEVFRAVKEVGVDVNKEELIKALQYDRHQYSKGYKDGFEDGIIKFVELLKPKLFGYYDSEIDEVMKEVECECE